MTQYSKHFCLIGFILVSLLSFNGCIMMPFMLKNMVKQKENNKTPPEIRQTVEVLMRDAINVAVEKTSPVKRLKIGRTLIYKNLMPDAEFRKMLIDSLRQNPRIIFLGYETVTEVQGHTKHDNIYKEDDGYYVLSTQLFRDIDDITLFIQLIDPITYELVLSRRISNPIIL